MARTHGRILCRIWDNPEFLALDHEAQRLYMFLLSQRDLTFAGLIPMRSRRWAAKVRDTCAEDIEATLCDLARAHFVLVDDDTEEVLVRTYVRNDEVYRLPKVMIRMREDARQIESQRLRTALRDELQRLPLDELSDEPGRNDGPSTRAQVTAVVDALLSDLADPSRKGSGKGIGKGSRDLPRRVPDTPRVRAGVFPLPPTPSPQPLDGSPQASNVTDVTREPTDALTPGGHS
ncbi:hypothetical protein OEB99_16645 [Actinotalea sp. M2MS4P-6]|uniref:hypothetical protein n=1 Tax=Actinotalea sp. M2MS4P-6 TaxID=2983762 RepID=UPI0021E36136|nr:hypothetical protein [Actinotalea sp. M2MS4P-6]MCV2395946.1 hypothetical protein [Actinotalea sp. M2MS4P-6]